MAAKSSIEWTQLYTIRLFRSPQLVDARHFAARLRPMRLTESEPGNGRAGNRRVSVPQPSTPPYPFVSK